MDINNLTIGQAKELASMFGRDSDFVQTKCKRHGFEAGNKYFIRTVTHHYLGECVEVCEMCIVMQKCAWIADDGRFHEAMRGVWTDNAEHEPYPPEKEVMVFYGGMLDAVEWAGELITEEK